MVVGDNIYMMFKPQVTICNLDLLTIGVWGDVKGIVKEEGER